MRRTNGTISNLKASRFKTHEGTIFQLESKGRKRPMSRLKTVKQKRFPLPSLWIYSGPQMTRWGPPKLGREIHFTRFSDSNVYLVQKHLHKHTQMSGYPMAQSTQIINHHKLIAPSSSIFYTLHKSTSKQKFSAIDLVSIICLLAMGPKFTW